MRTKNTLKVAVSYVLLASLTQLTGCGTRNLNLIYPPERSTNEVVSTRDIESTRPIKSSVVVLDVFDARTEKKHLSDRFTNYSPIDFHTGAFASKDNVAVWVNNAVTYELTKAGYNVLQKRNTVNNDDIIGLTVDIQTVFHHSTFSSSKTEVLLQATLDRIGEPQLTRQYEGRSNKGVPLASTTRNLENLLADALQDAILKMIVDFELVQSPQDALL